MPALSGRLALSWETLPNGARIARVDGYTLVVRRGVRGSFRFVMLARSPGWSGVTGVASGSADTAERAMAAAERAVASPPPGSAPRRVAPAESSERFRRP